MTISVFFCVWFVLRTVTTQGSKAVETSRSMFDDLGSTQQLEFFQLPGTYDNLKVNSDEGNQDHRLEILGPKGYMRNLSRSTYPLNWVGLKMRIRWVSPVHIPSVHILFESGSGCELNRCQSSTAQRAGR